MMLLVEFCIFYVTNVIAFLIDSPLYYDLDENAYFVDTLPQYGLCSFYCI